MEDRAEASSTSLIFLANPLSLNNSVQLTPAIKRNRQARLLEPSFPRPVTRVIGHVFVPTPPAVSWLINR